MSKKPAVAAKAAPRKRTVKAKPATDFPLKASVKKPVDWEKLAKRLQAALAKEMRESDEKTEIIAKFMGELNRKRNFFERLVCLTTGSV
jgi:menaquinone-dependent protoporphyrinogen IX oxidase